MFGIFESSRQKGQPIQLYYFVYGDAPGAYIAQTDCETPVVKDGVTYTPTPITRGNIVSSGSLDRTTLEVSMSRRNAVAEMFRAYPPTDVVSLRIFQGHAGDTDFKTAWFGEVKSCSFEKSTAKLTCEPVSTRMLNPGLRRNYQIGCPHVLYGKKCGASKIDHSVTATVVGINFETVELSAGWNGPFAVDKFMSGMIQWAGVSRSLDSRVVLKVIDATHLRLGGVPRGVLVGSTVNVVLGCNHQENDCLGVFNNINNFGGCSRIPFKNPIGIKSNFY